MAAHARVLEEAWGGALPSAVHVLQLQAIPPAVCKPETIARAAIVAAAADLRNADPARPHSLFLAAYESERGTWPADVAAALAPHTVESTTDDIAEIAEVLRGLTADSDGVNAAWLPVENGWLSGTSAVTELGCGLKNTGLMFEEDDTDPKKAKKATANAGAGAAAALGRRMSGIADRGGPSRVAEGTAGAQASPKHATSALQRKAVVANEKRREAAAYRAEPHRRNKNAIQSKSMQTTLGTPTRQASSMAPSSAPRRALGPSDLSGEELRISTWKEKVKEQKESRATVPRPDDSVSRLDEEARRMRNPRYRKEAEIRKKREAAEAEKLEKATRKKIREKKAKEKARLAKSGKGVLKRRTSPNKSKSKATRGRRKRASESDSEDGDGDSYDEQLNLLDESDADSGETENVKSEDEMESNSTPRSRRSSRLQNRGSADRSPPHKRKCDEHTSGTPEKRPKLRSDAQPSNPSPVPRRSAPSTLPVPPSSVPREVIGGYHNQSSPAMHVQHPASLANQAADASGYGRNAASSSGHSFPNQHQARKPTPNLYAGGHYARPDFPGRQSPHRQSRQQATHSGSYLPQQSGTPWMSNQPTGHYPSARNGSFGQSPAIATGSRREEPAPDNQEALHAVGQYRNEIMPGNASKFTPSSRVAAGQHGNAALTDYNDYEHVVEPDRARNSGGDVVDLSKAEDTVPVASTVAAPDATADLVNSVLSQCSNRNIVLYNSTEWREIYSFFTYQLELNQSKEYLLDRQPFFPPETPQVPTFRYIQIYKVSGSGERKWREIRLPGS